MGLSYALYRASSSLQIVFVDHPYTFFESLSCVVARRLKLADS